MSADYPILEFDPQREAVIEPSLVHRPIDLPERCVICFFHEVFAVLLQAGQLRVLRTLKSEIGANPVYEWQGAAGRVALFHPGVGAPLAAAFLEEVIALGARKFIACGGAGVLDSSIALGHPIIPMSAVRDEGTSYHYLPPGREVEPSPEGVAALRAVLEERSVPYLMGKTWTTDAIYRETPAKVRKRKEEGCLAVEMEAAALFAVARFRGVSLALLLYGGDDVGGSDWDSRHWDKSTTVRERLVRLAAEACLRL
jgi:uridine phosphorylase